MATANLGNLPNRINYRGTEYQFDTQEDLQANVMIVTITDGFQRTTQRVGLDLVRYSYSLHDLVEILIDQHLSIAVEAPQYRYEGPSNEELQSSPALRNAWEEYCVVRRLALK